MKVTIGIGCDRGTPLATLERALELALAEAGLARTDIISLASIDQKADEPALLELAQKNGWPLHFYKAAELAEVEVPNPSQTVMKYVGCPSVSEAAALLAAGAKMDALMVEKLRHRGEDGKNATISIAALPPHPDPLPQGGEGEEGRRLHSPRPHRAESREQSLALSGEESRKHAPPHSGDEGRKLASPFSLSSTGGEGRGEGEGKKGKIFLVGFGPGAREHMSLRALEAIELSQVVIGYSTYVKLVKDLLDGKQVIRKGMTEETDRCLEALAHARAGKTVALISSGDIGIYGMAGPTYEILLDSGWRPGGDIEVELVPGTTALSAAAALVGAPLTHDFCAISLSDLLTPWPVIAKRLHKAAEADFVIALYNPKSGRRTGQIVEAQRIISLYRAPQTPVAIVKSAYRRRQHIELTSLDKMSDCDIGMLSTVLIGAGSTFVKNGLMVTPRGYGEKYDEGGQVKQGEKAGRSLTSGLEGWRGQVRGAAKANPAMSANELAEMFDCHASDIESALESEETGA